MEDEAGNVISFTLDNFQDWGVITSIDEFTDKIRNMTDEEMRAYFKIITENLENMQIVIIKNKHKKINIFK